MLYSLSIFCNKILEVIIVYLSIRQLKFVLEKKMFLSKIMFSKVLLKIVSCL